MTILEVEAHIVVLERLRCKPRLSHLPNILDLANCAKGARIEELIFGVIEEVHAGQASISDVDNSNECNLAVNPVDHMVASKLLSKDSLVFALPMLIHLTGLELRQAKIIFMIWIVQWTLAQEAIVAISRITVIIMNFLLVFGENIIAFLREHCTCYLNRVSMGKCLTI